MTLIYDAVDVGAIPSNATALLAYIDGRYQTYGALRERFPNAHILTVTTTGSNRADICDVENGDASVATAAEGVRRGWYDTIYSSTYLKPALDAVMGGTRWFWFAADWTGYPHIVPGSVATQYVSGTYDISLAEDTWLNPVPPAPVPPPPPLPPPTQSPRGNTMLHTLTIPTDANGDGWMLTSIGWSTFCAVSIQGSDPGADGGYWTGTAHVQDRNEGVLVSVTNCRPLSQQTVFVWATA